MAKVRKELGVTFPFEVNGITGYGKAYTSIEVDTSLSIDDELEVSIKINNILDDVVFAEIDAQLARISAEYAGTIPMDNDGNPAKTQIDTVELTQKVREAIDHNLPKIKAIEAGTTG